MLLLLQGKLLTILENDMPFISTSDFLGTPAPEAGQAAPTGSTISTSDFLGESFTPPPDTSMWGKAKTAFGKVSTVMAPGQEQAQQGIQQMGQEVKALSNMLVGIPGGALGVAADIGSRIQSLAAGDTPQVAGAKARATSDMANELWGKVTGALGLTQDAAGSKVEELMGKGMAASDVAGTQIGQATGGVITKETVQSVRDTLLNALGVKGLSPGKIIAGKGTPAGEALTADAAIKASKARVEALAAEKATAELAKQAEDVAAGTAKAATVDALVKTALENQHPLDKAWSVQKAEAAPGTSPAWDTMVKGLVEPEGMPSIATRMAEPAFDPRFPAAEGVAKTKLAVPLVLGEIEPLIDTGIAKLAKGELISAAEAKAIRALKPLPDQGAIVGPSGKPYFQKGAVDPTLLKVMGLMGLGAVAGTALYNWFQSPSGVSGDKPSELMPSSITPEQAAGLAAGLMGATVLHKAGSKFADMPQPELIQAIKAGGVEAEGAARAIHDATRTNLEKSLYTFKDKLDVEGIVQKTYEKTFQAIASGQFKGESKISTFMHSVAKNEALNELQARKARPQTVSMTEGPEGEVAYPEAAVADTLTPERVAQNTEMAQKMQDSINKLPERQREVFNAAELEGLSYEEIAKTYGMEVGTVRSTLARAREALQKSLKDYKPTQQAGKIDQQLLMRAGLTAGGAAIGAGMAGEDNKGMGALVGAAAGFGAAALTLASPKAAVEGIAKAFAPDTRIRINQWADLHDQGMVRAERNIMQQVSKVTAVAPDAASRAVITNAIQHGKVASLPPELQVAAKTAKDFFDSAAKEAQKVGVLDTLIDDYVTNLWDLTGKNKSIWDDILTQHGGPSMSPTSRFALKRSITNLEVGKKLGLTPLTEDVAQIMDIYGKGLARSIENQKMITSLKAEIDPLTGEKLMLPSGKAPHTYVSIDSPQLSGMRVHPDIAPSLRFLFDTSNASVMVQGISAVNTAIKRSAVMGSLFHAKALMDGFVGAGTLNKKLIAGGAAAGAAYGLATGNNPFAAAMLGAGGAMMLPGAKAVAQAAAPKVFGENIYLKQLREGQAGDMVGKLLDSGLKISFEKGGLAVEDVGGSFYTGLSSLQKVMDATIPHSGLPVQALIKLNHALDGFMWERLHAGMKLTTAAQKLEALTEANAAAHVRDPSIPLKTPEALAVEASSFTNDVFGGLNWRRIAEATHSKWGRDLALEAYSPKGRRLMQLAVFAPDWTVSTTRAATQAFAPTIADANPVKLVRTFTEPQNAVALHRQYVIRSALYYATIANGINYAMSGHYVWDNKDPTTIDMGDGRTMQWSKHMMEPVHWVTKPLQQGLNKLGFFPKEVLNQVMGKEYAAAGGNAPPMDTSALGRLAHVGKSVSPIGAQQAFSNKASAGGAVSGFLGVPIYGKTFEERDAAKLERKQAAAAKRIAKQYGGVQ